MKKKLLALLLLVPILLIPIISCDGDALGGLSDLMGTFGKNSLVEGGAVVIDTSHGGKAAEKMSGLADLDDDDYDDAVVEIKEVVKEALASKGSTKAKAFVEEMKKPLPEDADVPGKVEDAVDELEDELGIEFEIETEGDLLAAVLLVDLMDKAKDDWEGADEEDILEFVSEALQVIDIVQTVSPVNGVKIDDILGELLGGDLSELFGSSSGISRNGDLQEEIDKALGMLRPILDPIIRAIGKGVDGQIDQKGLDRMIFNFKVIRQSFEDIAKAIKEKEIDKEKLEFTLTDFVNYGLSVVFTEANEVIKHMTNDDDFKFANLINIYIDWTDDKEIDFATIVALFDGGDEEEGAPIVEAILDKVLGTLEELIPYSNDEWILELFNDNENENDD
jgi:hypothetical protein